MQTPNETATQRAAVTASLAAAAKRLDALCTEINTLDAQAEELQTAGTIEATPYYRQGKYLYLIGPTVGGYRERQYIGNDPAKIDAALDAVRRHRRRQEIVAQADKLRDELRTLARTADRLTNPDRTPTLYYSPDRTHRY
jgi:hypothetical protein